MRINSMSRFISHFNVYLSRKCGKMKIQIYRVAAKITARKYSPHTP